MSDEDRIYDRENEGGGIPHSNRDIQGKPGSSGGTSGGFAPPQAPEFQQPTGFRPPSPNNVEARHGRGGDGTPSDAEGNYGSFSAPSASEAESQQEATRHALREQEQAPQMVNVGGGKTVAVPRPSELAVGESLASGLYKPVDKMSAREKMRHIARFPGRRKALVGGGVVGSIVGFGVFGFMIFTGPGQLVHLSQILQRPLAGQEESSDLRLGAMFRFARTGDPGELRVTAIGSKLYANYKANLASIGITLQTNTAGQGSGVKFSAAEFTEKYPEAKQMSLSERRAFMASKGNLPADALKFSSLSDTQREVYTVSEKDFNRATQRAFIKNTADVFKTNRTFGINGKIATGLTKRSVATALDAPSMFRPMKRLSASIDRKIVNAIDSRQKETKRVVANREGNASKFKQNVRSLKERANASGFTRAATSALLITAGMCLIRDSADDIQAVDRGIQEGAAIEAADKIALGEAVKSNNANVDDSGGAVRSFSDDTGNIWQAKSLKVLSGGAATGIDITDQYAQAFSGSVSARVLKETAGGGFFGGVACSTGGKIVQAVAGGALLALTPFSGGASFAAKSALVAKSAVAMYAATTVIQHLLVEGLKNDAVLPETFSGAVGGNLLAYGSKSFAGISGRPSGMVELSAQQTAVKERRLEKADREAFQKQSFFARTFSLSDYRSVASRFSTSLTANFSTNLIGTAFSSLGGLTSTMALPFSGKVAAAEDETYKWAIPDYGIPDEILNDPNLRDPYANADTIGEYLDGGDPDKLVDRAKNCFGGTVSKDSGSWDYAVGDETVDPVADSYVDAKCNDISNPYWKRMILFVFDTQTIKAADCYEGQTDTADQSCSDLKVNTTDAADSSSSEENAATGALPEGNAQELAQQLITSGRLTADSRYMAQIQAVADGDSSCNINPTILKMLVGVVVEEKHTIYISSLNRYCTGVLTASGTGSFHYSDGGGHALDVTSFDGGAVTGVGAPTVAYLNAASKYLPKDTGYGQVLSCGADFKIPDGSYAVSDTCNHQHIQVPKGTGSIR